MRLFLFFHAIIAVITISSSSLANQRQAADKRPFQLGMGLQFAFTTHDMCTREPDLHTCQTSESALGPQLHAYYRFTRRMSIGAVASLWHNLNAEETHSSDGASYRTSRLFWRADVDFRFYPLKGKHIEWWLSWELGLAGFADSHIEGALVDAQRLHQRGFSMGMGSGIDFSIGKRLMLGAEFRGILFIFGDPPTNTEEVIATDVGTAFWPTIGVINVGVRL